MMDEYNHTSTFFELSPVESIVAGTTVLILSFIGVTGNIITIIAFLRIVQLRSNVCTTFIICLCVADIIYSGLFFPFQSIIYFNGYLRGWEPEKFLCSMMAFFGHVLAASPMMFIGFVTINRYILIVHYELYDSVYKPFNVIVMITIGWAISIALQVPAFLGIWGKYSYDQYGICGMQVDDNGGDSRMATYFTAFTLPCIVIIVCYTRIFWVVHKSGKRMREHAKSNNQSAVNSRSTEKNRKHEMQITKMFLVKFLTYVILRLPGIFTLGAKIKAPSAIYAWCVILFFSSACINPIIYILLSKQYRKAYQVLLKCDRSKSKSKHPYPIRTSEATPTTSSSSWVEPDINKPKATPI